MTTYHYHSVPFCLRESAEGASMVVGWAFDGFPIVVELTAVGWCRADRVRSYRPAGARFDGLRGRCQTADRNDLIRVMPA